MWEKCVTHRERTGARTWHRSTSFFLSRRAAQHTYTHTRARARLRRIGEVDRRSLLATRRSRRGNWRSTPATPPLVFTDHSGQNVSTSNFCQPLVGRAWWERRKPRSPAFSHTERGREERDRSPFFEPPVSRGWVKVRVTKSRLWKWAFARFDDLLDYVLPLAFFLSRWTKSNSLV